MNKTTRKRLNDIEDIILREDRLPEIHETLVDLAKFIRRQTIFKPDDPNYPTDEEAEKLVERLRDLKKYTRT